MGGRPLSWTGTPDVARRTSLTGDTGPVADMGAPSRVVLVRHGVTELTVAGKLDGRGGVDPSLNPEGRRQAKAVALGVRAYIGDNPVRVITSSLRRAVETGAAISDELGVSAQIDAGWDEQGFGDWDDKNWQPTTPRSFCASGRTRSTRGPAGRRTLMSKPACWPLSNGPWQRGALWLWPVTANPS
jgi:hypothetical protein